MVAKSSNPNLLGMLLFALVGCGGRDGGHDDGGGDDDYDGPGGMATPTSAQQGRRPGRPHSRDGAATLGMAVVMVRMGGAALPVPASSVRGARPWI
jgi:hypothetical protein